MQKTPLFLVPRAFFRSLFLALTCFGLVACGRQPTVIVTPSIPRCSPTTCSYQVTTTADSGPGSLRALLDQPVPAGSTIRFATTLPARSVLLDAPLVITQSLTIDGGAGIVLDGQGKSAVVTVAAGASVLLTHLELRRGAAPNGAGLSNAGNTVLRAVTLRQNTAAVGAAIDNHGTLLLVNSTVSENTAPAQAGDPFGGTIIASHAPAQLRVVHATLVDNTAAASTLLSTGELTLANSVIAHTMGDAPLCVAPNHHTVASFTRDGTCDTRIAADPLLSAAATGNVPRWYAPVPESVLIDAADAGWCADGAVAAVDQRDSRRAAPCTVGAIEAEPALGTHTATPSRSNRRTTVQPTSAVVTWTVRTSTIVSATERRSTATSSPRSGDDIAPTRVATEAAAREWTLTPVHTATATTVVEVMPTQPRATQSPLPTKQPSAVPTERTMPTRTPAPTEVILPTRTLAPTEVILPSRTPAPTEVILPTRTPIPPTHTPFPTEPVLPTRTPIL